MKRIYCLAVVCLAAGVGAFAQEGTTVPVAEVGVNYSYMSMRPGGGAPSFTTQGGSATFVYNLTGVLGVVADLGGYHNGDEANFTPTTFTYLFGPRVSFRKSSRFTPYVQALFGGARVSTDLLDVNTGNSFTQNGFAAAYGGGLDVRLTKHLDVKPFQIEYLMTQTPNIWSANNAQNNLRYTAGVVLRLGNK